MSTFINDILSSANAIKSVPLPNPSYALLTGQRAIGSGLDRLQEVGKQIKQNRINSDIGTALASLGDTSNMSPTQYQDAIFGAVGKIDGVSALDAIGIASKLAKPRFDERKYRDDRTDAEVQNDYRRAMAGKGTYGFTTDDMGNAYRYNKNTGEYEVVREAPSGYVNPKNVVLKTVTDRDENGVETTRQVPFDKTTGRPVDQASVPDTEQQRARSFLEYKGLTEEQYAALPEADKVRLDEEFSVYKMPTAVSVSAPDVGVGVKHPKVDKSTKDAKDALESSYNLINNIRVPTEDQSGPIDSRIDDVAAWLNLDNPDSIAAKDFDAEVANLTTAFGTAQVKGVLSDKDTKFITDQMPDRRLSPTVNANRIKSIKKKIREAIERFNLMNPNAKINIQVDTNTSTQKGSPYGTGTEIISF